MNVPYGKQHITESDLSAVKEVLCSDYLTQGPTIGKFEKDFAKYVGSKYAVAVSNGTAALHLCAMALNVEAGQKVITTPITFVASANCIKYCGGEVVFADIDPETYLLDIKSVRELLKDSPKGTYAGIVAVDFAGRAVNLEAYRALAKDYGLWIIEDACHAPGGSFLMDNGASSHCGSCDFADLAIFSFHPVKHVACGEGGMITTNNHKFYERLLSLRTHGIIKNAGAYTNSAAFATGIEGASDYPGWYMEMQELGYNYRLTDIQAGLGISQLKRAEAGINRRREIATRYKNALTDQAFVTGQSGVVEGHAYHLYVIEVDNRLGLYNHLREHKIYAQIHYIPCHLMPYYREQGWREGDLKHAEAYYRNCISLPVYPTLSNEEQNLVIKTILAFYNG